MGWNDMEHFVLRMYLIFCKNMKICFYFIFYGYTLPKVIPSAFSIDGNRWKKVGLRKNILPSLVTNI